MKIIFIKIHSNKVILSLFILILFFSCSNCEKSKTDKIQSYNNINDTINTTIVTDSIKTFQMENIKTADISVWSYDYMIDTIIQKRKLKKGALSALKLIDIINKTYRDKAIIDYVNTSNDTIYVKINNSEYLTQQMGSMGAIEFLIIATFTLTEMPIIKYVNFDFEYGDHASPGTYDRKYFIDWINRNKMTKKK